MRLFGCAIGLFALLVLGACEPPGKPEAEPPPASEVTDFKVLYRKIVQAATATTEKMDPAES